MALKRNETVYEYENKWREIELKLVKPIKELFADNKTKSSLLIDEILI